MSVFAADLDFTAPTAKQSIPADSIDQLNDSFTDQSGKDFKLAARSGQVQLVAMFYSLCQCACPLIIGSAKGVEHALTPAQRGKLALLLISFSEARYPRSTSGPRAETQARSFVSVRPKPARSFALDTGTHAGGRCKRRWAARCRAEHETLIATCLEQFLLATITFVRRLT